MTDIKKTALLNPEKAKEMLIEEYSPKLFAYALRLTGNPEEAFDLSQETIIESLFEERIFYDDFNIKSWLFRVCTNKTYDFFRKAKRFLLKIPSLLENEPHIDYSEKFIKQEENKVLKEAMKKLPEKYRLLLILRYFEDLSYQEISEVTTLPLGTVMSRLNRAKSMLKGVYLNESMQ